MLTLPTEATAEKMNWYGPTPSHVPLKTTNCSARLIHASRHITVNTDVIERDRKILSGKGSLGH